MSKDLAVVQKNGKFVVTKNGEPVQPQTDEGQTIVTTFDNREDAEKYRNILSLLQKKKTSKSK